MNCLIGLIVNPVAGMGGSVGLKGTDGEMYKKALEFGATPVTPKSTDEFLSHIKKKDCMTLVVAPGKMGEQHIHAGDIPFKVIGTIGAETSNEDTKRISKEMVNTGAELLIFVGGDGTARDIYDAIRSTIPVVAVPAGVKVFSSVFAVSARAAGEMVDAFIEGAEVTEEEVLDIDETAFREGRLASRLYGYLLVPLAKKLLQGGKEASNLGKSSMAGKQEIASYIVEEMDKGSLYLLGPGTTLKAVADELGVSKTLLGIDAVFDGNSVGTDLNEKGILALFDRYEKRKMLLTPIGGNGFILGRGSKQFTPEVINFLSIQSLNLLLKNTMPEYI
jgi:predicted polyphosphate/ATP-dependent NAD kinase